MTARQLQNVLLCVSVLAIADGCGGEAGPTDASSPADSVSADAGGGMESDAGVSAGDAGEASDAGETDDAGGGGGPTIPATTHYRGTIARLPLVVRIPELDLDRPPLLAVYLSSDHGATWFATHTSCNGGVGQLIRDGEVEIQSTYCTTGATDYQIAVQPADENLSAERRSTSWYVATSWADLSSLPLVTVYNSRDGVTWHLDHGTCGAPDTWRLEDGKITLYSSYCSGSHYRIALGSSDAVHTGSFPGYYRELEGLVDASALPVLVPWFAFASAEYYESTYDCGRSAYNLRIFADGTVRLETNYCVTRDVYALTIGR